MSEEFELTKQFDDLLIKSEPEGFQPGEMIDCPQCARKNPPTRFKCLYCGADLPVTGNNSARQLARKLETWEKGFNIILLSVPANFDFSETREIANLLRLDKEDLDRIIHAGKTLPLARAESETEAEILAENLREKGFETLIISDENLIADKAPRRLRGVDFYDDKIALKLFNVEEIVEIAREDLILIVTGGLFERRIESTQKYERKKENKILDTTEISNDELLIDLYHRHDKIGFRIESNGFDFSSLGNEKQLLVSQNMKILTEKLRLFAPAAQFEENYNRLRAELSCVWEAEEKKNSRGLVKRNFGKLNLESVITIDNLQQFTRYSRMLRNLL